jgi:hypothetical protein
MASYVFLKETCTPETYDGAKSKIAKPAKECNAGIWVIFLVVIIFLTV